MNLIFRLLVCAALATAIGCSDDADSDTNNDNNNQPVVDAGGDSSEPDIDDETDVDDQQDVDEQDSDDPDPDVTEDINQADSAAADLRATLTSLLTEHVYLSGIAVYTAAQVGGDVEDPEFEAAAATLDDNTVELGEAIGSLYGDQAEEDFLALWREHIGYFVEFALGHATDDQPRIDAALTNLADYGDRFAAFISTASEGRLPEAAIVSSLETHVDTLGAAIAATINGETDADGAPLAYDKLHVAAHHMIGTAEVLSIAFDDQFDIEGDAASDGATLRANLTALLQEHVFLSGIAVVVASDTYTAEDELDTPAFTAAAAALDDNTVELGEAIGSLYGDQGEEDFLALWREHIGFFVEFAVGHGTDDQPRIDAALADLAAYGGEFAAFISGASEGILPESAIVSSLEAHVDTLGGAIAAVMNGEDAPTDDLHVAAQHMVGTAEVLSVAFATQFDEQF